MRFGDRCSIGIHGSVSVAFAHMLLGMLLDMVRYGVGKRVLGLHVMCWGEKR